MQHLHNFRISFHQRLWAVISIDEKAQRTTTTAAYLRVVFVEVIHLIDLCLSFMLALPKEHLKKGKGRSRSHFSLNAKGDCKDSQSSGRL